MGIYPSGRIFGVLLYIINENENTTTDLYKCMYEHVMTENQMYEAYLFYKNLNDKTNISFKIYTECCDLFDSHYNLNTYMVWFPISLESFVNNFGIYN